MVNISQGFGFNDVKVTFRMISSLSIIELRFEYSLLLMFLHEKLKKFIPYLIRRKYAKHKFLKKRFYFLLET